MNNLLPREIPLHEKFDLKGSLSGRFASKKELSKASPTLKDLDFLKVHSSGIALSKETFLLVKTTISSDCRVLRSFKIMDYSLLVGIHQISKETFTQLSHVGSGSEPETLSQGIIGFDENGESFLIFLGIIDILQRFKLKKKFEYGLKSAVHDKDSISVCPPKKYSQRFLNFVLKRVFHELDSQQHNALVRKLNIIRSFSRISSTQVSKKKPRDEVRAEETGNNNEDSLSKRRLSF
ncbi:phosphatidylinositol 4-phosphate 5-kinase type-1 beta-like [Zophobas morio]|uniref:phosphatidylinositol 4-phosphate 5-kinase type-1 beta-like n=1 Tax=Zophobas morio TaxID=2755281 RepID=UPI00308314B8